MTQSDQLSPSGLSDVDLAPGDAAAQERKQLLNVTYVFLLGFKTSTHTGQSEMTRFSFPSHFYEKKIINIF